MPDAFDRTKVSVVKPEAEGFSSADMETLRRFRRELFTVIRRESPAKLVIDFEDVQFIGAGLLGVLVEAHSFLNSRRCGEIRLSDLQPHCREVVEATHLDRLFEFEN